MAGPRNSPQIGLEDEVINDGEVIEAVAMYDRANEAVVKVGAKKLLKALKDAGDTVKELLPKDDGKPHVFRVSQWSISQTPKGEARDTHVVPKNPTRRFKKVVDEPAEDGGKDE